MRVLAVTGGHRVDLGAFSAMLDGICAGRDWAWAHAEQPGALRWLAPRYAGQWDAVLLHDIPGLWLRRGAEPRIEGPSPELAAAIIGLLDAGQGLVVLHHALAGWPGWEGWAEAIGGRFLYRPGPLRGRWEPASGYRMGEYTVRPVDPEHPICAGIEPFTLQDELYHAPVLTDRIHPLLTVDADLSGEGFLDAHDVVRNGESTGTTCAGRGPASALAAWTTVAGRSPVAVLLPGDGPATFAHAAFRRLVGNALAWAGSAAAHAQAGADPVQIPGPARPPDAAAPAGTGVPA